MNPANQIALWADQLRHISAEGGHFARNVYDRDNYKVFQTIAMEMMALVTETAVADLEPLRSTIFSRPCPLPVADAAIINEREEILLIRRADNGQWAMPGGATQVGEANHVTRIPKAFEFCREQIPFFDS